MSEGIGSVSSIPYPVSLLVRCLVVSKNKLTGCAVLARLAFGKGFAGACAARDFVNLARVGQHQKIIALHVQIRVRFNNLFGASNRHLPASASLCFVEGRLNNFAHSLLIDVLHFGRFPSLS